ncbi:MAG TPA: ATP-binding protein [Burkholderiaceae bacterium]|jgi:two-component system OmpR family sensor kinase
MNSIRNTLLLWLSIGVSIVIILAAVLVYFQARKEANALADYQMKQLVASLPAQAPFPVPTTRDNESNMPDDMVVRMWDNTGFRIYQSHELINLPQTTELGFSDVNTDGVDWRVYNAKLGDTIVQVAQLSSARHQIAARVAMRTVVPLILLLPFFAVLIWITVGRGLAAVKRAAAHVQSRDVSSLASIPDDDLPREIQPLTHALNDLLSRLRLAIDAQSAFIADAAHELKTPLTALKLQIQLAERARTEEDRQSAFADLAKGLERATHLVHQLLTLARYEPNARNQKYARVDLVALAQSVVADFVPIADSKKIDLGMTVKTPVHTHGSVDALRTMLSNLIDNAIRYTPEGGRIDVLIQDNDGRAAIAVKDSGPGIPEKELPRVIDRFYRVPGSPSNGSGLGLAIVKQIVAAHNADITLTNIANGLHASVTFNESN